MMSQLRGRSVISIEDLTKSEIEAIFSTADMICEDQGLHFGKARGKILATLFFEPSTRTRLSFESAMQRLGGGVISAWDVNSTSVAKGESLADTVRVVGGYADAIVLRHPWEGAAKLASAYAPVPIINGGDGAHEHPTQTLCDLYTLRKRYGTLSGLKVALCGDLKNGRTIHSLAFALARFGANIIFVRGEGKEIPQYVLHRLQRDYSGLIRKERLGVLSALFGDQPTDKNWADVDAIYMTPTQGNQLALSSLPGTTIEFQVETGKTSIYVTRRQTERGDDQGPSARYPRLTANVLRSEHFKDISILHPLPRVDELSPEGDDDPRSLYFKQSSYGVPIRMALLSYILGCEQIVATASPDAYSRSASPVVYAHASVNCCNDTCISNQDKKFARPEFKIVSSPRYSLLCTYCDNETVPEYFGNSESRIYYPIGVLDRIRPPITPDHLRFFRTSDVAISAGFREVDDNWYQYHPKPSEEKGNREKWIDLVVGQDQ